MKVAEITGGNARSQKMNLFPKDRWSGTDHLWWTGARPGDRLMLRFNVPADAKYELFAVMTKARDYGIVQPDDRRHESRPAHRSVQFARRDHHRHRLPGNATSSKPDAHQLGIQITGANPKAVKGYMFGLDYLYLAKKK